MDNDAKVQLARMEGKIDLMNERHETVKSDLTDVKQRLHGHGNRLTILEARDHERKGAFGAVKLLWAAGGFTVMGITALVIRSFGG